MVKEKEQANMVQKRRPVELLTWPEEIERLVERTMHGIGIRPWTPLIPFLFVLGRNGTILIRADLPNIRWDDMELVVEGDMLVIRGQRNQEGEVEDDYSRGERAVGEVSRAIALPEGVELEAIEASYKDGVLEVRMPRPVTPKGKRVQVRVE